MKSAAFLLWAAALAAQQQQPIVPHIGFVYPAGARQGATLEVTVGGQFLNNASEAYITGKGVEVSVKEWIRPLTGAQAANLQEEIKKLNDKRATTRLAPEEEKRAAEIRERLVEFSRRASSPAIGENVVLRVSVLPDAAPGRREIRLFATPGITNPIAFFVGQLPEYSRKAQKVPPALSVVNGATPPNRPLAQPEPPTEIQLPAVLNGQMMPAKVDRYRFHAAKGQHLVATASARALIPYISDAVPGWFQAVLTLRDAAGKELASEDHYRFHQDPVLLYNVPADGDYQLDIHDSIYRGREDFVYRVTVGELPFLTGIFPLGGRQGTRTAVAMEGSNLPSRSVIENDKGKPKGVYQVASKPFAVDGLPETRAGQANHRREKAQRVKLPVIVNGRVERPGEQEFFRFEGKAGEEIVAEVLARRLDSPLDSVLRLTDAAGKELAFNDDFEDKAAGLLTHQADSRLAVTLPAKGTYYLQLGDTQRQGGPEFAYRLRISHPEPDFDLRVAPSSINVRAGASVPITVYAIRRDGFAGPIALQLKDMPPGFGLTGALVPDGQDSVRLTLLAPPRRIDVPVPIHLEGRAEIAGQEVRRAAVPAEDMMQAFAYHHLVPAEEAVVSVLGAGQRVPWRAIDKPVRLPAGGSAQVEIFVPPALLAQVKLALNDPPAGISIASVTPRGNGVSVVLRAEAGKTKPGLKGNLIVDAFADRPANAANPNGARRRQFVSTLPAIPFEVVTAMEASR